MDQPYKDLFANEKQPQPSQQPAQIPFEEAVRGQYEQDAPFSTSQPANPSSPPIFSISQMPSILKEDNRQYRDLYI